MLNCMILLSIVIPTKNRYNTLIPVINLIIKSIPSLDYEIIIQDNSVANSQPEELSQVINNSRVRYFYNPIPVSVSENTNKALENAKGEYVCFIGDDDIVIPAIIDEVRKLKKDGGECLIYPPCYYWWDTVQFVNKDRFKKNQALWLPAVSRRRLLNSSSELQRVLSNGGVSYYQLPRLYHGIVRKVLDRIYKRSFTYVIGASPDMSLAVSIAMEVETYSLIDFPLTVFGSSRGSGGGLTAERKHHGAIEEQEFLPKSNQIKSWFAQ